MPVRKTYGIRHSLNKSLLETQIQLGAGTSLSAAKRPLTLATFLYLAGAVVLFAVIFKMSVIKSGGWFGCLLFIVGYVGIYYSLLTRTKTLDYRMSLLPVMVRYWRRGGRTVNTSLLDDGSRLQNFLGIRAKKGIDDDGMVHFIDGDVGIFMDVVGNASLLIFDDDRDAVLADARTIYKNLPPLVGLTLITQSSTQDVGLQIQSKLDQLHHLQLNSPGLRQIIKQQGTALHDEVGSNFSMIRQYLLIRGKEEAVLTESRAILEAARNASNNFLKEAKVLTNEEERKGRDGVALNEPRQIEKLLTSIFNDYQDKE